MTQTFEDMQKSLEPIKRGPTDQQILDEEFNKNLVSPLRYEDAQPGATPAGE